MKIKITFRKGTKKIHANVEKVTLPNGDKDQIAMRVPQERNGKRWIKYKVASVERIVIDLE